MKFTIKDPGSAITHFIGLIAALIASVPMLLRASRQDGYLHIVTLGIFMISMILVYAASTVYHTFDLSERTNRILRKIDHCMIFLLIAGTYTPVCILRMHDRTGYLLCALVWLLAIAGMLLKIFWITCPKWLSSLIYIAMGWLCLIALPDMFNSVPRAGFIWLIVGGLIYTAGGIIYALKLPLFNLNHKNFGSHEIFHLFVMAGSVCHYIAMYMYVAPLPVPA